MKREPWASNIPLGSKSSRGTGIIPATVADFGGSDWSSVSMDSCDTFKKKVTPRAQDEQVAEEAVT